MLMKGVRRLPHRFSNLSLIFIFMLQLFVQRIEASAEEQPQLKESNNIPTASTPPVIMIEATKTSEKSDLHGIGPMQLPDQKIEDVREYRSESSDKKHDELKENLQSEKDEQFPTDETKLMAESQQIGASPHPPIHQAVDDHPHSKRNYASKECGAKVLYSNEEAENKGAILNDPERDDYMRNPCRVQNKFLIIELCETIQPTSLDIANFELFSSSPKNFRIWGSERYPTQEWMLIGEFESQDNREVQTFHVNDQHVSSYAKFIKLELLTHHGNEHFCTLSTFRLYGTSMVDEYEAEAAGSYNLASVEPTILPDQKLASSDGKVENSEERNGDPLYEDYENNTGEMIGECNVNEYAVEDALIKKKITNINDIQTDELKNLPTKENESINEEARENISTKTKEDNSHIHANMFKTIVEFGSNIKNVLGQAFSNGDKNKNNTFTNDQSLSHNRSSWRHSMWKNPSFTCRQCAKDPMQCGYNLFCQTFFTRIEDSLTMRRILAKSKRAKKSQLEFLDKILRRQTATFCPLPAKPQTCSRKSEVQKQQPQPKQNGIGSANNNANSIKQQDQAGQHAQKPIVASIVNDKGNFRPLPGTSTTHKESVFMKLNKRLSILEQNMSASAEQLMELNKKCSLQTDETKQDEKITKTAEKLAKQESQRVEDEMKQKISELNREVHRLSQQFQALTSAVQMGGIGNGYFYRPFLTPIQGYAASDAHCHDKACVNERNLGAMIHPLHSTSSAAYSSMPIVTPQQSPMDEISREGLWTTSQVICLIFVVQIVTLIMLKIIRSLYDRLLCSSNSRMQPTKIISQQEIKMSPQNRQQEILINLNNNPLNT